MLVVMCFVFFFHADDVILDVVLSLGLVVVYKVQVLVLVLVVVVVVVVVVDVVVVVGVVYTSDAADDLLCVVFGGRRVIVNEKNLKLDFR